VPSCQWRAPPSPHSVCVYYGCAYVGVDSTKRIFKLILDQLPRAGAVSSRQGTALGVWIPPDHTVTGPLRRRQAATGGHMAVTVPGPRAFQEPVISRFELPWGGQRGRRRRRRRPARDYIERTPASDKPSFQRVAHELKLASYADPSCSGAFGSRR
jgi:hypothetical protein